MAGSWSYNGFITAYKVWGLTGVVTGTTVTLYGTTGDDVTAGGGTLYRAVDTSGYNGPVGTVADEIAYASANKAFRGIALAPVAEATPSLSVPITPGAISENGGAATGTVTCSGSTADQLVVNLASSDTAVATVPPSVTIPAGQPSASFPVTAVDDHVVDGSQSTTITASAAGYNSGPASVTVTDDDVRGIEITQTDDGTAVAEAGPTTDTYLVKLKTIPTGNVSISATVADGQTEVSSNGATFGATASLSFTVDDWNTPQTIRVRAVDDSLAEANSHAGVITPAASGGGYTGVPLPSLTVSINDDDAPGVTLVQSGGNTTVDEARHVIDSYTLRLNTPPAGTVAITITADSQVQVSDDGANFGGSTSLSFTPATWDTPKTVSVRAVDDTQAEPPIHIGLIAQAASGGGYSGVAVPSVTVYVIDNDRADPGLTWNPPAPIAYGTPLGPTQLNATASVPGSFSYSPAAGTVLSAGANQTLTVTFTPADSNRYNGAIATVKLMVTKAEQAIMFAPLPDKKVGDAPFALVARASSGLPVSYSASGACIVAGATLSLTGAGACTVTAAQAGNANYAAAPSVERSFAVKPAGGGGGPGPGGGLQPRAMLAIVFR